MSPPAASPGGRLSSRVSPHAGIFAGHEPTALISMFEKFHAHSPDQEQSFFSTHPHPLERAQRITEALE